MSDGLSRCSKIISKLLGLGLGLVFDGSQESDSDSCVVNNVFDVRKE